MAPRVARKQGSAPLCSEWLFRFLWPVSSSERQGQGYELGSLVLSSFSTWELLLGFYRPPPFFFFSANVCSGSALCYTGDRKLLEEDGYKCNV